MSKNYLGFFYILTAVFGLASIGIVGESLCSRNADWSVLLLFRYAGSGVILLAASFLVEGRSYRHVGRSLWVGVVCEGAQAIFLFLAIQRIGAGLSALVLYFYPIAALLFYKIPCPVITTNGKGFCRLQMQLLALESPISKRVKILTMISVIGPLLISRALLSEVTYSATMGLVFALCASLCYGYYFSHGALYLREQSPLLGSGLSCVGALFVVIPLVAVTSDANWLDVATTQSDFLLILVALTALPLFFLLKGMNLVGGLIAALVFSCEPMITALLASLIHNTDLPTMSILGGLISISLIMMTEKEKTLEKKAVRTSEKIT